MASIYQRPNSKVWRAVVRIKDHPTICNHFDRKQEAQDWAANVEREIKLGRFPFERYKAKYTFADLFERYINNGTLEHQKAADDTIRHLNTGGVVSRPILLFA
jgi:hypothetical protein